jgi:chromosome segregation ATPase
MENLNAEKIIKALECCGNGCVTDCEECPRYDIDADTARDCMEGLMRDALSLINSQEQRIEAYRQALGEVRVALAEANKERRELTVELAEAKENIRRRSADYDFLSEKLRETVAEKKRLTEENEAWQKQLISTEEQAGKAYYDLACEVEGLRAENERLRASSVDYRNIPDIIAEARADTVRKMREMLLARKVSYGNISFRVVPIDDIDQIAKEMLEGVWKKKSLSR